MDKFNPKSARQGGGNVSPCVFGNTAALDHPALFSKLETDGIPHLKDCRHIQREDKQLFSRCLLLFFYHGSLTTNTSSLESSDFLGFEPRTMSEHLRDAGTCG